MEKPSLTSRKTLFQKFVGVDELHFKLNDKNTSIRRFVVTRPDAVAIVLYHRKKDRVVLIRQFRAPVYTKDQDGFVLEIPAGVMEDNEKPEDCAIRETIEETGYKISQPRLLTNIYPSCGLLNERISIFYAEVSDQDKIQSGGGLDSEHEYLDVMELSPAQAFEMIESGRITDAKTQIGLFFLKDILNN